MSRKVILTKVNSDISLWWFCLGNECLFWWKLGRQVFVVKSAGRWKFARCRHSCSRSLIYPLLFLFVLFQLVWSSGFCYCISFVCLLMLMLLMKLQKSPQPQSVPILEGRSILQNSAPVAKHTRGENSSNFNERCLVCVFS